MYHNQQYYDYAYIIPLLNEKYSVNMFDWDKKDHHLRNWFLKEHPFSEFLCINFWVIDHINKCNGENCFFKIPQKIKEYLTIIYKEYGECVIRVER